MTGIPAAICIFCRHLKEGSARCDAFPDGIPDDILFALHDHREPYEGDRGIRFELKPGEDAAFKEWLALAAACSGSCEFRNFRER